MKFQLALLLLLVPAALAACPNACSGHGECEEHDACVCHTNWEGGDCSNRVCPFSHAWVTTSNGDLNYDGDRFDGTEYNDDYAISQGDATARLVTQRAPGGTWENWPYHAHNSEGHFYMECSNRGLCTRSTGECECFEGYTGSACHRSVCPLDCSGHGTCETISEMAALASSTYALWDRDMQRTCLCDPGYTGTACQERMCPYGDDPLTTGEYNEVQWVDVYADEDFSGNVAISYVDYYGEKWTSDYFAISPSTSVNVGSFTNAEDALVNIPNDVLTDVTVTREYCEEVIPGLFKTSGSSGFATATTNARTLVLSANDVVRCPDADATNLFLMTSDTAFTDLAGSGLTETVVDDTTCYKQRQSYCTRLRIDFTATPGDISSVTAEVDQITVGGLTDFQDNTKGIGATVVESLQLGTHAATGGITAAHTAAGSVTHTCPSADLTISGKDIGCSSQDYTIFGTTEVVRVECVGNGAWKALGLYTVDTAVTATLTLDETAPGCAGNFRVTLHSEFITLNADVSSHVMAGDRLSVGGWNTIDGQVSRTVYTAGSGTRVFLSEAHLSSGGGNEGTSTAGTDTVTFKGKGDTESNECSDRGLCNRESGVCACFKGYTGDACEIQNSLAT